MRDVGGSCVTTTDYVCPKEHTYFDVVALPLSGSFPWLDCRSVCPSLSLGVKGHGLPLYCPTIVVPDI